MKKHKLLRAFFSIILIVLQLISLILISYALLLYNGIETFYRILGIIILIYLFFLFSFLLLRSIKKRNKSSFLIPLILTVLLIIIEILAFYYLNKIYNTLNSYSDNNNKYYTSLVTYNKSINDYKSLNNNKIGIVKDEYDIEGYILPIEVIDNLKLEDKNKLVYYDSTIELLYALKKSEIDCAFFSSNYIDMFSSIEGYENIENDTKVLYEYSKVIKNNEEIDNENASLNKPFTMLLIGVDSSNDGVTSGYNADVLLLVSFNPKTLRATMTSIPRDMYIKTACSDNTYKRINTTTWGSTATCAVNTVENLFNVNIDYYAKINFKGLVQLVDAVGGIDVNVDYSICEQNSSRKWGKNTIYVKKGKQHLNGEQALVLARNRHSPNDGSNIGKKMAKYCPTYTEGLRNDYTRGKNQMKVILGVIKAATKLDSPNKAIEILESISSNFQTNVKTKDVLSLYNLGKSIVISDSANLINIQRLQLTGQDAWGMVYEKSTNSYPAVILPYKESIEEIKNAIDENLGKKELTPTKEITFDINNPYKDIVNGNGNYTDTGIITLKNMSLMSVSDIKDYANEINKKILFIDYNTKETIDINDYSNYYFYSQNEHKDTIINQIDTITIYVKKRN